MTGRSPSEGSRVNQPHQWWRGLVHRGRRSTILPIPLQQRMGKVAERPGRSGGRSLHSRNYARAYRGLPVVDSGQTNTAPTAAPAEHLRAAKPRSGGPIHRTRARAAPWPADQRPECVPAAARQGSRLGRCAARPANAGASQPRRPSAGQGSRGLAARSISFANRSTADTPPNWA